MLYFMLYFYTITNGLYLPCSHQAPCPSPIGKGRIRIVLSIVARALNKPASSGSNGGGCIYTIQIVVLYYTYYIL